MAGRIPIGKAFVMTTAIVALGYGIMAITTPNEEQFYNALAPDLKRKVDDSRAYQAAARKKAETLASLKRAGESDEPVWATTDDEKK